MSERKATAARRWRPPKTAPFLSVRDPRRNARAAAAVSFKRAADCWGSTPEVRAASRTSGGEYGGTRAGVERGKLGLGAGGGRGTWGEVAGVVAVGTGPRGPGVPAAGADGGARAQRECRGQEDSVRIAETLLSLRRSAVPGSGPELSPICVPLTLFLWGSA